MEIIAELKKPYTEEQRCDFIVEYNHRHQYEIQETEDKLLAVYNEPTEEEKNRARCNELHRLLDEADYWTSKRADGEYTEEEWAEKVAIRKAWREELRSLENGGENES